MLSSTKSRFCGKTLLQTLFFFLLVTQICFGQGNSLNFQSTGGIDSVIQAFMTTNHIPGLAACVVKDEKIGWEGYYGLANVALQDSVKQNTSFMLASVSKPFVGTALMQLWEEGKFQLDDSINAYLPFPVRNPNFPSNIITFRQLLSHVSSIRDTWSQMPEFLGDPTIELGTFLEEYLTPGGLYYSASNYSNTNPPASQYNYTNVGASLCAYLVEVISEIPFDEYSQDNIFVPLGMTNTGWFLRDLDTTLIARPYIWNGVYNDLGLRGFAYYPSAQLRTTIESLALFLSAHICYGKVNNVRILDSTTVSLMRTSHYPLIDPTQGLIWYSLYLGQRFVWGHAGILNGVRAAIWIDEVKREGVILLANLVPTTSIVPVLEALFALADTVTIPVELISFSACYAQKSVELIWSTATETNNLGFSVERKTSTSEWLEIGFVSGRGTTTEQSFYSYADNSVSANKYSYRLKQIDFDGSFEYSNTIEVDVNPVMEYNLSQNYPNPFNPSTSIQYALSSRQFVKLTIYDLLGREIEILIDEEKQAGTYELTWYAEGLPSGVYFYQLKAGNFIETKKMLLLK